MSQREITAPDGWTPSAIASGSFYLGGSFYSQDSDANATYDEVRIWDGALTDGAIASSFEMGPDATISDIEESTVIVATGATLNLGGNTLAREYVSGCGTVSGGGTLTVSKELRAKLGETITVSGSTLNLDGAKLVFSAEDIAALATANRIYTLVEATNGGTITGRLLQPATDSALPSRWRVRANSGTVKLGKFGAMIIVR